MQLEQMENYNYEVTTGEDTVPSKSEVIWCPVNAGAALASRPRVVPWR